MSTTTVRRFNESGYEILADGLSRGEVVIWSVNPLTPRLGDVFLIENEGRPYDAVVEALVLVNGGWSATCRVEEALV